MVLGEGIYKKHGGSGRGWSGPRRRGGAMDRSKWWDDVMILGYDTRNEFTMHMFLFSHFSLAQALICWCSEGHLSSYPFSGLDSSVDVANVLVQTQGRGSLESVNRGAQHEPLLTSRNTQPRSKRPSTLRGSTYKTTSTTCTGNTRTHTPIYSQPRKRGLQ